MNDKSSRGCGLCGIAAALFLAAAAGLGGLYYSGMLSGFRLEFGEDGPDIAYASQADEEAAVLDALKEFAAAQKGFHKKYGAYSSDIGALLTVDKDLKGALAEHPPVPAAELPRPELLLLYHGYYFSMPLSQGTGRVDLKSGYVIVAEPVPGGSKPTFAIGPAGTVLRKEMGGRRITNVSQINAAWTPVDK